MSVFSVVASRRNRLRDAVRGEHERLFSAAFDLHDAILATAYAEQKQDTFQSDLSVRELECLNWTLEGKSAEEVAIILGLSVFTVNRHASNATRKLDCSNKFHAAVRALRNGLI